MNVATVMATTAALLALAGCAAQQSLAPAAAQWTPCSTGGSGARCDVRITPDPMGRYECELGKFRVEPDFLGLTGGRPVNIQWNAPQGFGFCDGDGVRLKPQFAFGQPQVLESFASDANDGGRLGFEASAACKPFRNWRWGNATPGQVFGYDIQFSDKGTLRRCKLDPWIRNG